MTDHDPQDLPDDPGEPIGSCEACGQNLYEKDDRHHCNRCLAMEGVFDADESKRW